MTPTLGAVAPVITVLLSTLFPNKAGYIIDAMVIPMNGTNINNKNSIFHNTASFKLKISAISPNGFVTRHPIEIHTNNINVVA